MWCLDCLDGNTATWSDLFQPRLNPKNAGSAGSGALALTTSRANLPESVRNKKELPKATGSGIPLNGKKLRWTGVWTKFEHCYAAGLVLVFTLALLASSASVGNATSQAVATNSAPKAQGSQELKLAATTGAKLDLIFCLDITGSMEDDIDEVKAAAENIVNRIAAGVPDFRVAIVCYRDFGDTEMFKDYSFSSDENAIVTNIKALTVSGGGDWPEAVYEALLRAINNENNCTGGWRSGVTKIIILMGDAPPHEENDGPDYKYTIDDVITAAKAVDPAIVNSIVVGTDNDAVTKFQAISTGTGGSYFTAETAADVVGAIENAVAEAVAKAQTEAAEEAQAEEFPWLLVGIGVTIVVLVVIALVLLKIGRKT